jgi:hypothetical protein
VIRIALALFTGHPYDMFLWAYSARLFYESKVFDIYFPTLPLLYYLQLASYSLYAFLRVLGMQDFRFLFVPNYMIEGVFLKLPMILADLGTFLVITRFTRKLLYGALFYFNPFIIYLSAVWGMYDSVMMLPLVYGMILLSQDEQRQATIYFGLSGLAKLFGFIPFAMMFLDEFGRRRWRLIAFQLAVLGLLAGAMFAPLSSLNPQSFFVGLIYRMVGLGGARFPVWNIAVLSGGIFFFGANILVGLVIAIVLILFLIQRRTSFSLFMPTLRWSLVAAVLLNIFSQAQPQWISWVIPLSVLYGSMTRREGLVYYSYFYGVAATLVTTLMLQGIGFLFIGLPLILLPGLELFQNSIAVYATTVLSMQIVLLWRVFRPDSSFGLRDAAVVSLACAASYLLFTVFQLLPQIILY